MMRALLPFRRLAGDERGTSVIELAIVAPVLSLLTMGIVDISNGYARRLELTQAASRALERLAADDFRIPENDAGVPNYTAIKADAAAAAGVNASQVTVVRWLECNGVEQPAANFKNGCPVEDRPECEVSDPPDDCHQVTARYVEIQIDDKFWPMFGTIFSREPDGSFPLWAEAAMRIQ